MVHLTASGLRKIAVYLDQLGELERFQSVATVGHMGYAEVTLDGDDGDVVLRVERVALPAVDDEPDAVRMTYVLAVEVP